MVARLYIILLVTIACPAVALVVGQTKARAVGVHTERRLVGVPDGAVSKPHIVFILCDDLGWRGVGVNNPEVRTPNINKLFEEGITQDAHYVYKSCAPTRASFLTGRLPFKTRAAVDNFEYSAVPAGTELDYVLLPAALEQVGYTTHLVGKWHQGFYSQEYQPTRRGFHTFFGMYGGCTDHMSSAAANTQCDGELKDLVENEVPAAEKVGLQHTGLQYSSRAVSLIEQHDRTTPMFLMLSLQDPHGPIQAPEEYVARYAFSNVLKNTYYGMISIIDDTVGSVVEALRKQRMYDDTLVIFTSDNGAPVYSKQLVDHGGVTNDPLRGGKGSAWEGGVRVPTAISGGFVPRSVVGRKLHNLMSIADWYATFAHLTGAMTGLGGRTPSDSINQWPYIVGLDESGPRTELILEHRRFENSLGAYNKYQGALRVGHYKLLVGPQYMAVWNESDWNGADRTECIAMPCLFNVHDDPGEHTDLATSDTGRLEGMLRRWNELESAHDPEDRPLEETEKQEACANWHHNSMGFLMPWHGTASFGKPQLVVWVHGFGSSGTSVIASMLTSMDTSVQDSREPELKEMLRAGEVAVKRRVFSLAMACDDRDVPLVRDAKHCGERVLNLANCEFMEYENIASWSSLHTTGHSEDFTPKSASSLCRGSDAVVFKTTNTKTIALPQLQYHVGILQMEPRMKIIDVVRDPRGIYASVTKKSWGDVTIKEVCDCMLSNLELSHARVHRVVFEELVKDPKRVVKSAYEFLGLPFTSVQENWIQHTFDASCMHKDRYADCHENSQSEVDAWKASLSDEDRRFFWEYTPCQTVAKAYDYPEF